MRLNSTAGGGINNNMFSTPGAPLAELGLGIARVYLRRLARILRRRQPVLQLDVRLGAGRVQACVVWLGCDGLRNRDAPMRSVTAVTTPTMYPTSICVIWHRYAFVLIAALYSAKLS